MKSNGYLITLDLIYNIILIWVCVLLRFSKQSSNPKHPRLFFHNNSCNKKLMKIASIFRVSRPCSLGHVNFEMNFERKFSHARLASLQEGSNMILHTRFPRKTEILFSISFGFFLCVKIFSLSYYVAVTNAKSEYPF